MVWNDIEPILTRDPGELIDVHMFDMTEDSWLKFYEWAKSRIVILDGPHGRLDVDELDIHAFLREDMCYTCDVRMPDGSCLAVDIIEADELFIDEETCELASEEAFNAFLANVALIADVVGCENYIICPEFKKDEAFIVNGDYLEGAEP